MTKILIRLTHELPSIACFCLAGFLAYNGIDGWGWFLFVGVLATTSHGLIKK